MTAQTIRARLKWAADELTRAGVPDAARDARKLMAHALGEPLHRVGADDLRDMPPDLADRFGAFISARLARRPVSKITGMRSFWKHDFSITDATLDPRPDTETLVVAALREPFLQVLDLGTGSGCILLSLLDERPHAHGLGTDLSGAALMISRQNAARLGLSDRVSFVAANWFEGVSGTFDLIVSNPPYIAEAEMADLDPEVRDHDPRMALTPGGDGLDAYRAIAAGALANLVPGGRLLVEIGPTQGAAVHDLFRAGGLHDITILPDLDGRDRVVCARAPDATHPESRILRHK
jgi:release factor glutamine methyltransferase